MFAPLLPRWSNGADAVRRAGDPKFFLSFPNDWRRVSIEEVVVGFVVYEKGSAPVKSVPTLTIQRKGLMSLNRAAWGLIGEAEAVELLYDAERKIIALRPGTLANQNAYPVRPQASAAARGPLIVAANMFTRFIGLDTSEARRWVPSLLDGMLTIDLKTPGARAISNRGRAASEEAPVRT